LRFQKKKKSSMRGEKNYGRGCLLLGTLVQYAILTLLLGGGGEERAIQAVSEWKKGASQNKKVNLSSVRQTIELARGERTENPEKKRFGKRRNLILVAKLIIFESKREVIVGRTESLKRAQLPKRETAVAR